MLQGECPMLSDQWNIWGTGLLFALFTGAFVTMLEFLGSGIADLHEVLFICFFGFVAGLATATVRNSFVDRA
jgi:hypothetical protein